MPLLANENLDSALATAVQRLRDALAPQAVYLFGSYVYGEPTKDSDLDLLVVVGDSPLNAYQRDAVANQALGDLRMPIDVQVYTQAEFDERASLPVSFERTVKQKGKLVYAA